MRIKLIICVLLPLLLSGCRVIPTYCAPKDPHTAAYVVGDELVDEQQHIAMGEKLATDWWSMFGNEQLNTVIKRAFADNYNIAVARRTLAQAEEAVKSKQGALWPQIGLTAIAGNQLYGKAFFGPSTFHIPAFTAYQLGPTVTWNIDLFGATRFAIEQQKAFAQYQAHNLDAVYITLSGNVVNQVLEIAASKAEMETMQRIIDDDQKTLEMIQKKYSVGSATRIEVLEAQVRLEADRAKLPAMKQRISEAQHMLAILVGKAPADWQQPEFTFEQFNLPKQLPVCLPSELVHKRPDIMAAEANLHAAHAMVGVATANLYPSISITGELLQEALNLKTLFDGVNTAWSIAATLTQPIFQGGTLRAEKRKSEQAYKAALAQYKQTILTAFKQVADLLAALKNDAETVAVWQRSVEVAAESLDLAHDSYAAGASNLLQLQDSQRNYENAELNLLLAKRQQFLDTAQLFVAVGGSPVPNCAMLNN